jgi:hypothetical protein
MDATVSHDEGVVPGLIENQENRNIQGGAELLHPAPEGRPVSAESSPFVEMLNRTAIGFGREIDDTFIESGSEYIQEKRSKWELSKIKANNEWFLIGALKAFFIFMSRGDDLIRHEEKDRTPLRNPAEATRAITYLAELSKQGVEIDIHDYAQSGLGHAGLSEDADRSPGCDPLAFARGFALGQPEGAESRQAALQEFERALSATIALAPDLDAQKQIVAATVHNVALEAGIITSEGAVNDEDALEYLTTQMNSLWVKSSPLSGGISYAVLKFAEQIAKRFDPDADDFSDIIEAVDKQALTMAGATVTHSNDAGKVLEVKAQFKAQIWGALLGNDEFNSKIKTSLGAIYSEVEDLHDLSKTTDTIAQTVMGRISQTSRQVSRLRSSDEEFEIDLEQLKDRMPDAMFNILRNFTPAEAAAGTMSLERLHEIDPSLTRETGSMSASELLTAMDITKTANGHNVTFNENGGDIYVVLAGHGITTDEAGKNIVGSMIGWNKTFTRQTLAATLTRAEWHQIRVERFVSEFDPVNRTVARHADNSTFGTAEELQKTLENSGIPPNRAQVIAANFNPDTQMVDTSAVIAGAEKGAFALPKDIVLSEVVRKHTSGDPAQVNVFAVFTDERLLQHSVVSAEMRKGGGCTEAEAKAALFSCWVGYASTDGIMRQYQEMHKYFSESDSHIHATVSVYDKEGKEARLEELKAHKQKLSNFVSNLAGSEAEAAFENLGLREISAIDDSPLYKQHNLPMEKYYGMLEEALGLGRERGAGSPTVAAELIEFLTPGVAAYLLITQGKVSHEVYSKQQIENPRLQQLHRNMTQQIERLTSQDVDGGSVSFGIKGREITLSHWSDKADLQAFKEGVREAQGVSESLFSKNAPLSSYHSAVGATYAAGVVGENVCDWSHVDPAGFSMDVDGVGHNDSALVAREHPIYAEFASNHARFVRETEVTSKEQYAQALDAQVLSYSQEFRKRKNAYEDDATKGCDIVGAIVRSVMNNVQSGQPALTEEKFLELTELISRQKFKEALRDADLPDLARNCMQAILDKDFDAFNRYAALYKDLDREDPSWMLFHKIKYRNLPKGSSGPAFGMAQFFKAEGQDHLYLNRMADVCFMVIQPKGQERSVNRENITPDQVTWVEEAADQLGLGDQSGEGAKKGTVMAVRPGTIVMTFSDGIGEFLTQEEILEVIKEGHSLERFKEKIMVEDRRDDIRMRASQSTVVCKPHEFDSAHYHDDVSYSWMVLK